MIGKTLNHYEVIEKLGEGGMGHVYLAEDTRLHRQVALKVLPAEMADDARRIERFEREARAVAALNHPNIVTIFSVEEARGVRFLTMELVDGKSLDDLIPFGGVGLDEFFELAVPLASAVASAHNKGIIHRDIKPGNVMVNSEGVVKLLDLGLARLKTSDDADRTTDASFESLTQEGHVIGTVPYMAPEQLSARSTDHRVDIFSLGIVFYEMLTGNRPFQGDSSNELISSILRDTPEPLSGILAALPADLGRVVDRCLDKDPAQRFQQASELHAELRGLERRHDRGELPIDSGAVESPAEPRRLRTQWLAALGVAIMVAILAGTLFSVMSRPPPPAAETVPVSPGPASLATPQPEVTEAPLAFPDTPPARQVPTEAPVEAPTPVAPTTATAADPGADVPTDSAPAPAPIHVSLTLSSEVSSGVVTLYADALQIYRRAFQFAEKMGGVLGRIGMKKKASGGLEDGFTVPPGTAGLRLYISLAGQPARQFTMEPPSRGDGTDRLTITIESASEIDVRINERPAED